MSSCCSHGIRDFLATGVRVSSSLFESLLVSSSLLFGRLDADADCCGAPLLEKAADARERAAAGANHDAGEDHLPAHLGPDLRACGGVEDVGFSGFSNWRGHQPE